MRVDKPPLIPTIQTHGMMLASRFGTEGALRRVNLRAEP